MAEPSMLEGLNTGVAIREYLTTVGEGNPYGFYKLYKEVKETTSYSSIRRYFYILEEIGLIRGTRWVESKAPRKKHLYEAVPERLDDPAWLRPQIELYPDTKLGRKGYERLRERGLTPKGGRREEYRK